MTDIGFSVDTHLLRELGELLVGRDSTAVLELIKNAYDADATVVTLDAVGLGGRGGRIRVIDDGNGMTADRFRTAFLRIAGRTKELGERRSPRHLRRYTGQKGIGRLATHKLAAHLVVTSVPRGSGDAVTAAIDWDRIEEQESLNALDYGLDVESFRPRRGQPAGTTFELTRLRRQEWTGEQRTAFVREVASSQPPAALLRADWPPQQRTAPTLLPVLRWRESSEDDPGFRVRLSGDFEVGDDVWEQAAERFTWCVEIDATGDAIEYQVSPLVSVRDEPDARTYRFRRTPPASDRPRFQARFFVLGRATRHGPLGGFTRDYGGIRVYLEGFRVLPYGERGNDWLRIARDYRGGSRNFRLDLSDLDADSDDVEFDDKEALQALLNENYFGAVFLTDTGATGLRSLVNREGFVPDEPYEALVDIVRAGVNLSVRVRRAVHNARERRKAQKRIADERERRAGSDTETRSPNGTLYDDGQAANRAADDVDIEPEARPAYETSGVPPVHVDPPTASEILGHAQEAATRLRTSPAPVYDGPTVELLLSGLAIASAELDLLRSAQADLRVLAGVGLQLGAFVHDINGMLGQAATVRELMTTMLDEPDLTTRQRTRLRRIERAVLELTHTLTRQSSYLTDVLVADPRRRRSRTRVADRIDPIERLLTGQLATREVDLQNALPPDLKTPPMFPAEVSILLTNLLTNAVKNAGSPGIVRIDGRTDGSGGLILLVHNTGTAVDLEDAEKWFRPFESTTTDVDEVLGQGLGLGLPITRALVEDYRGTINFIPPRSGFATSIRVDLPDPDRKGRR